MFFTMQANLISYIVIVLLIWISPALGMLLSRLSVEELAPGKLFFKILRSLLFVILLLIPAFFVGYWYYIVGGLLLIAFFLQKETTPLLFSLFGLWLFAALVIKDMLYPFALILFLYGLFEGTRQFMINTPQRTRFISFRKQWPLLKKDAITGLTQYAVFLLLAFVPLLILLL
jgi:hypothetical protein